MTPALHQIWREKRGTRRYVKVLAFETKRGLSMTDVRLKVRVKNIATGRITVMERSDLSERFEFIIEDEVA